MFFNSNLDVLSKVAPVEWDVPISVFGVSVRPGQLIHADQHGFLVVPEEDEAKLEEATSFMDRQLIMKYKISLCHLILFHKQPRATAGSGPWQKRDGHRGSSFSDSCAHAGG